MEDLDLDLDQFQGALAQHPRSSLNTRILTLVCLSIHHLEFLAILCLLHLQIPSTLLTSKRLTGQQQP